MSMSISGSNSAYGMYQQPQKASATNTQASANAGQTSKSGNSNSYYGYLSENYDCVKNGKVSISPTYLRACAEDPAKAKELEENLAVFKDCYDSGLKSVQKLGKVIAYDHTWSFDANGELTMQGSVTIECEGGGKSMKEYLEELEEERKKKEEQDRLTGKTQVKEEIEKTFTEKSKNSDIEVNVKVDIQYVDGNASPTDANQASIDVSA